MRTRGFPGRFAAKSYGRRAYDLGEELESWIATYADRLVPEAQWRYTPTQLRVAEDRLEELRQLASRLYDISSCLYAMA